MPPPRRLSVIAAAPIAAAAVLVAAGCGGGIDKGKLESSIKSKLSAQLASRGASTTVKSVHCVKRNDNYHFSCVATASDGSTLQLIAKCNSGHGGSCVWRRA